jgi:hypothetical protein
MTNIIFILRILITFLLISLLPAIALSAEKNNWSTIAKADLSDIYQIIKNQTPVLLDNKNKSYRRWMTNGLSKSFELAETVRDYQSYTYALEYYVNGFHDEHINIDFDIIQQKKIPVLWPGFFVYYHNGNFYVSSYGWKKSGKKGLPPINSKLVQCHGTSPKDLMLHNVFPYKGNPSLEADWVEYATQLFINDGNVWVNYPKQCVFRDSLNKEIIIDLSWDKVLDYINPDLAAYSYNPKFDIVEFDSNAIWVSIPSFSATKKENLDWLKKLVSTATQWRNKKLIVIDVRGNSGGNSQWGEDILTKLYSKQFFSWVQSRKPDGSYNQWRVSTENLNFLKTVGINYIKKTSGINSGPYKYISRVIDHMEIAIKQKKSLVKVNDNNVYSEKTKKSFLNPVKARVIIITDGRCGSSCLSFLDQAIIMPDIIQAGAPTHANSIYTGYRKVKLLSGFAQFGFPMMATINRKRLNNQPYIPKYIFPGDINDTEKLKKWIVKQVGP